jgi:hypothetical protein
VIAGFNTDVEFGGVVYHVQTEDKGEKSRLILTLVYDRGTILASKRVKYDDLTEADLQPDALAERLQRQHQLICAAVKAGRLNDLKQMAAKERKAAVQPDPAKTPVIRTTVVLAPAAPAEMPQTRVAVAEAPSAAPAFVPNEPEHPLPEPAAVPDDEVETIPVYEIFDDGPVIEGVSIIEEEVEKADKEEDILPAEAVAVVSVLAGTSRPTNTKLGIELLGDAKFKGGDRKTLCIMICRGTQRKVISDAEIMVKVLGSSFRPVIFHARSDANGLARVHLQLPHFEAGRAALLVRARNNGDEAELRKIVAPG